MNPIGFSRAVRLSNSQIQRGESGPFTLEKEEHSMEVGWLMRYAGYTSILNKILEGEIQPNNRDYFTLKSPIRRLSVYGFVILSGVARGAIGTVLANEIIVRFLFFYG